MKGFLSIISLLFISFQSFSAWYPVNTGITDDFTSISYKNQTTGLITGKKGVYLSTTGGITAGSWARVQNCLTPADSIVYNHSQFYSSAETNEYSSLFIYFCGRDTVNSTGVIFRYSIASNAIELVYSGGTRFNKITNDSSILMYAVGDNGKLVYFNESNPVVQTIATGFSFNLTSIDATLTSLKIGSNDYLVHGTIASPGNVTFTSAYYPGRNMRHLIIMNGSSNDGYAVGKNMLKFQSASITEPHQYYADSLMANSVTQAVTGGMYIGTNNGIYQVIPSSSILEFQPSSSGKRIQSIYSIAPSFLIACGDNGVILYTNDSGGTPEPYAQIDFNGACLNVSQPIYSTKGTVTNCTNYVDNVLINSNCNNYYNYTFTTAGTHQIKLIVSNAFYSKTIIKDVQVVLPPLNLLTAVADDTLCKSEALDITIFGSQPGIYYSLYKSGSNVSFGTSTVGDGSDLDFHTNSLTETGTYYIKAAGTIANCVTTFTSTIPIVVEHPEAKFHIDLINAEANETVRFYEKCSEAVNFEWQFSGTPAITNSTLPDVTNSFAALGSSPVTLIAGTANNCYDTTTISGPFIYQPYTDNSWLMVNGKILGNPNDPVYGQDIKQTIKSVTSGYLIAGHYENRILKSRVGDSLNLPGYGGYVAKYDDLGILKWCIKTDPWTDPQISYVSDITEDSDGNIYVIGKTPSNGMIDNRGDTACGNQNFILKLDSLGHMIWNRTTYYYHGDQTTISHDYDNSVYVTSLFFQNPNGQVFPFMLNGVTQDSLTFTEAVCSGCSHQYKILKIDGNGQLMYDFMVEIGGTNTWVTPQVEFDASNNMYVWGSKETSGVIHSPAGDIIPITAAPASYGGNMYISKMDVNGNYLWKVESYTEDSPNDVTEAVALIADASGNLYLTGQNNFDDPSNPQIIINADHSQSTFYGGQYFVAKINTNGMTEWINGNYKSEVGVGFDLLLHGDTLYTVGAARVYSNQDLAFEVIGNNSTSVSVQANPFNYFIGKYLTDGTMLATYLNGPSDLISGLYLGRECGVNLIKLNDGYFLLNKTIYTNATAQDTAVDFGFSLIPTARQDGTQLKFQPEQGIEFLPHFYTEFTYHVCYASSFTYPDGTVIPNVFYYTSRIDSLVSVNGIDSIVKYQVIVNPNYNTTSNLFVCKGSDVLLGDGTTLSNIQNTTTVQLTLQSIHGCDSISNVTINVNSVNATIHQNATQLYVPNGFDSYQWLHCNLNFFPIPNQVSNTYTPIEDGSYAVIVSSNNCVDTSDCYLFDYYVHLSNEESVNPSTSVAPNPTKNKTTLNFGQTIDFAAIVIYSNDGKKIFESTIEGVEKYEIDLTPFERGTYFVKLASGNQNSDFIIVKN
ncbi:T9SS type A sorting domain-containing protein [Fluviicola sp.]|uniref:T9SS type A sorting domain-containing protein n=1 Tax=Fluviicola sp. TaxID=1917219 RepID=UPI0031D014A7